MHLGGVMEEKSRKLTEVWRLASSNSRFISCVCVSAALPPLLYFLVTRYHGVATSRAMYVVDFIILAYFSSLFFLFQRKPRLAIIPFFVVTSIVFWAAIYKYLLLGVWVRFADVHIMNEGWQTLSWMHHLSVLSLAALALGITLYNLRLPRPRRLAALLIPLVVGAALTFLFPGGAVYLLRNMTHALYGNDPLYRSVPFALGYDVLETWQFDRTSRTFLSRYPAAEDAGFPNERIRQPRNVHIFVLESFMDPALLGIPLPRDPVDPRLRTRLGGSALSPVFAGRSAQAEFELLCGTPAYDFLDPVTFNDMHGEPIPCLPNFLRNNGYLTMASHDVTPNFFNAQEAYRSLGFSRMHFRSELPSTDKDGPWVSADAQISFNKKHIKALLEDKQPFLNYIFFTTGHIPYEMNPLKRPQVIETTSTDEVTRFVNAIYYNSQSLAQYVDFLSGVDPTSIIVIVGDHQGVLPSIDRTHSREYSYDRFLTPYLFLDAGETKSFGDISQFQIPNLIVSSLLDTPYVSLARSFGFDMVRPFNKHAFYHLDGEIYSCPNADDARCEAVARFRDQTVARWLRLIDQSRSPAE